MQNLKPRRYSNLSTARIKPGVALLDQVQEAQAAVAVLLGDGDDQPQVAFRQAALGLLVLGVDLLEIGHDPVAQAGGRFLRGAEDVAVLGDPAARAARRAPCRLGLRRCLAICSRSSSTRRLNSSSGLDHRLDPLRAQAEFLDQPHGSATAAAQPPPGRPALGRRRATCWWRC